MTILCLQFWGQRLFSVALIFIGLRTCFKLLREGNPTPTLWHTAAPPPAPQLSMGDGYLITHPILGTWFMSPLPHESVIGLPISGNAEGVKLTIWLSGSSLPLPFDLVVLYHIIGNSMFLNENFKNTIQFQLLSAQGFPKNWAGLSLRRS